MKKYVSLVIAFFAFVIAPSFANDFVKMRSERFEALGDDIKKVFRAHIPANDFAAIEAFAISSEAWAKEIPSAFPAGSNSKGAKPEIWENWSDFESKANAFGVASAQLARAAQSNDGELITAAAKALGETCKACHTEYRQK